MKKIATMAAIALIAGSAYAIDEFVIQTTNGIASLTIPTAWISGTHKYITSIMFTYADAVSSTARVQVVKGTVTNQFTAGTIAASPPLPGSSGIWLPQSHLYVKRGNTLRFPMTSTNVCDITIQLKRED